MRLPSDTPLPPIDPLAVVPFPAVGEHFGSYVRRLAAANGLPSIGALARHLGLLKLSARSAEKTWSRLAEATGIGNRLDPLRMLLTDERRGKLAQIDGEDVQYGFLDRVHLRSCPACLAETGMLPMRFAVRQITACASHGLRLDDECSCGHHRRSFDARSIWNCPSCGTDASDLPRTPADDRELLVAGLLSTQCGPTASKLPARLMAEPLSARAAVIERLGQLALLEQNDGPSTSHHNSGLKLPDKTDTRRRLRDDRKVVLAAADLLIDWPKAYHGLLDRLLDRHADPKGVNHLLRRFSSRAGHLSLRSFVDHDGRIIDFAEETRIAFLSERVSYSRNRRLGMARSDRYAKMPCAPTGTVSIPRSIVAFVTAAEFVTRLHVGKGLRIEACFEAGLIGTVRNADGEVVVLRSDFDALLARVKDLPNGDGDDRGYDPSAVLGNRRNGYYRQRHLLEDVFAGRIRSRPTGGDREGMASRLLNRADFERQRLLCKVASRIIEDHFVGVPFFVNSVWSRETPSKRLLEGLRDGGHVRTVGAKKRRRFSVRDIVLFVQAAGAEQIFLTDAAALASLSRGDWRSIVDDSLYAKKGVKTPYALGTDIL